MGQVAVDVHRWPLTQAATSSGSMISCRNTVTEYISAEDWRVKANANVGYSHAGLVSNVAGKVIANFWLDEIYAPEEGMAHRRGGIHIHDLDCLTG